MIKQIFLTAAIVFGITASFFCKEQNHKKEVSNTQSRYIVKDEDSMSHANGKKLFGLYCLTCHTFANNQALLGNTKDITLDKFFNRVLKDSVNKPTNKSNDTHFKFDTLTKKDVSDIKYYLDKG